MKSYIITINGNKVSQTASQKCYETTKKYTDFSVEVFNAVVPKQTDALLSKYKITWNYPWQGEVMDFATGLKKSAYRTVNPKNRIACALSHYLIWKESAEQQIPILILEHDAIFLRHFDPEYIIQSKFDVVGINNPLGATRRSKQFLTEVLKKKDKSIIITPSIDEINIPQGLAGNSAYIVKPRGARTLVDAVHKYGMWPNDALMCKQLIPNLGVTTTFYTTLQGTPSTTTG